MRPAGEVSKALLQAVQELATPERAPILKELAAHAQVAEAVALQTLKDMKRYGRVCIARKRTVPWCTRPVAEWCLPIAGKAAANDAMADGGFAALARAWG
ncbi:hypothetical protein [Comamonas jiangduensis]|jgi:hypothetical protein|uniref:hypothetical protein n=1 Tax=Comamonas jiangduensis TaxID=1194168 RepID=UPI0015826265|nr:hypothetical protein [Comamonas jiangduensis]